MKFLALTKFDIMNRGTIKISDTEITKTIIFLFFLEAFFSWDLTNDTDFKTFLLIQILKLGENIFH